MNDVALKVEGTEIELRQPQDSEVEVFKPSQALSPQRFAFLWDVTCRIAGSQMVPESLRTKGNANNKVALSADEIQANVFFVVEISDRWGISPFALLPCASVVHGRLGFEGKVIDAVLEGVYGIKLSYAWSGEGDNMKIVVSGTDRHGNTQTVEGTVSEWKTTGTGSPWRPATYKKMLAYRGAREWARLHKSVAMLGIVSDDELHDAELERRANLASDVGPRPGLDRFRSSSGGADASEVQRQLNDAGHKDSAGAQRDAASAETDRQLDGGANRINGDKPSGKTPDPAQPKGSTGETSEGGEQPSTASGQLDLGDNPSAAQLLENFSDHLLKVTEGGMKALRPAASAWRDQHGWPKKGDDTSAKKIESIYAVHSKRLNGDIDEAACKAQVAGIIAAQ